MKTPKLYTIFVFVSAVLLLGCEKSDELPDTPSPEESDQAGNVTGKIIVPTGSTLDPNTLRVLSATDDNPIVSGVFALEVPGDYTSIYVVNSDDEVVMIGYQYPGKPDNDITPQSTALGILMMSPAALDISGDGKKELVNDILKDPNFPSLLAEVEQSIASGKPLFDTTNAALLNTVGILFQSAAFRLNATQQELPVNMFGSGRNYTFNNSGTAYSTIIGVYKDDEHLEKITVEGLKMVPTSLTELWTGYGGASGSPVDHDYSLVGDGDFTFKFRTGKPGFGDGSPEHDEAFKENLAQFSLSLVLTVLPVTPIPGCYLTIKNNVYNTVSAVSGISSNSNVGMGTVLFTVAQLTLNNISSLVECAGAQLRQNWFSSLLQQFNFIQKAFGVLSNGANTTLFGTQWALSESVVDVCFSASGTEVDACGGCDGETTVTDAEGNVYKIVEIGSQCWMAENLNASGGIPQVSDPKVWRDAYSDILGQQPAWCYYDNDPANGAVYGKLYNWYAVNTVNLCPPGWHVPTNADWNKLRDYLDPGADGNDNTAGRKMKTTTGWFTTEGILPPNESTNESGFTALPGGLNNGGSFGTKGSSGYWWSSTDLGTHYQLYSLRDELRYSGATSPRGMGFSCRCLKD